MLHCRMSMDNDYAINIDEIMRTIDQADVLRIRFLLLDKRLLIDNRFNEFEGPLIKIVPLAGSSEESFRNLKRLRPRFPLPDRMTAIWWPKYIETLRTSGVWGCVMQRIAESGYRVVLNTGPYAGQQVFHLHVHLLGGRLLRGGMG